MTTLVSFILLSGTTSSLKHVLKVTIKTAIQIHESRKRQQAGLTGRAAGLVF